VKITVVIATYNAEKTLEACLDSIRKQTYCDLEVVVADGASSDQTLQILNAHASEIAVMVSEKDRGIYDAWNKVIPRATGEWLIFLGADDALWDSDTLANAAIALAAARENIVYGKIAVILPDNEILNFEGEPWEKVCRKFRHEMTIPHQGTFHRRTLFQKYGLFNPDFRICGDYEFLLRELKHQPARFIPNLVISRMGFGGISSNYKNVAIIIRELGLARKLNGFYFPSPYILFRKIRYFIRNFLTKIFGKRSSDVLADTYRRLTGRARLWGRFHD